MEITIKNWLEIHKICSMFFDADIYIYKKETLKDNLLFAFTMNSHKTLEDYLNTVPTKFHNKKIKYVEFCRNENGDGVDILICIK